MTECLKAQFLSTPRYPISFASQDSQQCSQKSQAPLSLFFFPFWARLSADTADELFRAHQRPCAFLCCQDYSSFTSPEVTDAKARESINRICFHQSRIKRERGKEAGWKLITGGSKLSHVKELCGSLLKSRFQPTLPSSDSWRRTEACSPSHQTRAHTHAHSHILLQ